MQHAVPPTVAQLRHEALYPVTYEWLLAVNTRAVWVRLAHVAAFLAGILAVHGAKTCLAISQIAAVSHDALNRLLIGEPLRPFLQAVALYLADKTGGELILDDTFFEKVGKRIEGVKWLYSSADKRKARGLNVVVLLWQKGNLKIPLSYRLWKKPADVQPEPDPAKPGKKGKKRPSKQPLLAFDGTRFKTKIELAIDLFNWAHSRGFKPDAVLFDSFYAADAVLKRLKKLKWRWVSRLKSNRCLMLNGSRFKPNQWAAMAKSGQGPRLSRGVTVELPGWGPVKLIAVRFRPEDDLAFLVGSEPGWRRCDVLARYRRRWAIEVIFRDSAQLLGLRDCQCRSFQAQDNHVALVLIAYAFLQVQRGTAETTGDVKNRLTERPVPATVSSRCGKVWLSETLVEAMTPKVRPGKFRRKRQWQKQEPQAISAVAA